MNINKKNKEQDNLSLDEMKNRSTQTPKMSFCFMAIAKNDHPEDAESIRKTAEERHKADPKYKFSLFDYQQGLIIRYGNGKRIEYKMAETKDERLQRALAEMNSEKNKKETWAIKNGYDYTLIKYALRKGFIEGYEKEGFKSTPSFINFLKGLGFDNCCDKSTFNRYYNNINGDYPCTFTGSEVDTTETKRRNAIIDKFIELMNT